MSGTKHIIIKSKRSSFAQKMEATYNYVYEEVDPLISRCITFLLCTRPQSVLGAMLEYFHNHHENGTKVSYTSEELRDIKKIQAVYFEIEIAPVIQELVRRVMKNKPANVLEFLQIEVKSMIDDRLRRYEV